MTAGHGEDHVVPAEGQRADQRRETEGDRRVVGDRTDRAGDHHLREAASSRRPHQRHHLGAGGQGQHREPDDRLADVEHVDQQLGAADREEPADDHAEQAEQHHQQGLAGALVRALAVRGQLALLLELGHLADQGRGLLPSPHPDHPGDVEQHQQPALEPAEHPVEQQQPGDQAEDGRRHAVLQAPAGHREPGDQRGQPEGEREDHQVGADGVARGQGGVSLPGRQHRRDRLLRLGARQQRRERQHRHAQPRRRRGDVLGEPLRPGRQQRGPDAEEDQGHHEVQHAAILPRWPAGDGFDRLNQRASPGWSRSRHSVGRGAERPARGVSRPLGGFDSSSTNVEMQPAGAVPRLGGRTAERMVEEMQLVMGTGVGTAMATQDATRTSRRTCRPVSPACCGRRTC